MSQHTQIFLFTKGRVGRQKTLNYFPEALLRENVTIVCPKSEVEDHRSQPYGKLVDFWPMPEDIHLADKRMKVITQYQRDGGRFFMMADDDLRLSVHTKDGQFKSAKLEETHARVYKYFTSRVPKLLSEYPCVGLASRFMAPDFIAKHGFLKLDNKCCCFFGYDADKLLSVVPSGAVLQSIWGLDTTLNLLMLRNGMHTASDYNMLWDSEFATEKSPGGANLYRTTDAFNLSFLRMMVLFPGLISRGRDGLHHSSHLKIDWTSAFMDTGYPSKLIEKGAPIFQKELNYQKTTVDSWVSRLPSGCQTFYRRKATQLLEHLPA